MARVVLLFGNTAQHNSRALRMATSLVGAGHAVTLVARAGDGLPERERRDGYEVIRVPAAAGPRWLPAPRLPRADGAASWVGGVELPTRPDATGLALRPRREERAGALLREGPGRLLQTLLREGPGRLLQALRYQLVARRWAAAVEQVAPAADVWQADGLVMLPIALRLRARHGGRVVYDSLEIHAESGRFARLPRVWRWLLARRERAWARSADAVITVSQPYADVLARRFGIRPAIVMNCPPAPAALAPGEPGGPPRPRRFHALLDLSLEAPVVLYHGYLFPQRGIEQLCEAIGLVEGAHLVVMGFGERFDAYRALAARLPHAGRVHVVAGVPPEALLEWVGSADVAAMPIQGNTLNHRLTTPNKLFEALAAGVPVVASDLPGMAPIVRATGAGVTCDPGDPADIARAIRAILEAPEAGRETFREHALAAARRTYNWERQAGEYLGVIDALSRG